MGVQKGAVTVTQWLVFLYIPVECIESMDSLWTVILYMTD
jgi:hypothetical protein